MEKFNYRNFGKFFNEIISNPDIVKKRDFLAEKDLKEIDKLEAVKDLYKYISLSFYMAFSDNEDASKIDIMSLKKIEREFPEDVYTLKKNPGSWQYLVAYYNGMIDAYSRMLKLKDNRSFKTLFNNGEETGSDDD